MTKSERHAARRASLVSELASLAIAERHMAEEEQERRREDKKRRVAEAFVRFRRALRFERREACRAAFSSLPCYGIARSEPVERRQRPGIPFRAIGGRIQWEPGQQASYLELVSEVARLRAELAKLKQEA